MAKKTKHDADARFKRRLLGYRRADVDDRVARLTADATRRIEDLEFEVRRLTEELSVAAGADEDLALRATRRAVDGILADARAKADALSTAPDTVIDLRDPESADVEAATT